MNQEFEKKLKEFAESQASLFLDKVSQEITTQAKAISPVKTGRLRDSINWFKRSKLHNKIGSDVHYAKYVELGTRYMAPRAFLRKSARRILGRFR